MARARTVLALTTLLLVTAAPAADAAKKKKKAKKPAPITATINGTFTVRNTDPNGFGNDNGPKWQQIKVTLKDAKLTFGKGNKASAAGTVNAQIDYDAFAKTNDRSWQPNECDSEERTAFGTYTGKIKVGIKQTNWRINQGKSVKFRGWTVTPQAPDDGIDVKPAGYWKEYESILMTTCLVNGTNDLLGSWNPGFAQPNASGRLSKDSKSVALSWTDTEVEQSSSTTGSIKFSAPVDR